MRCQTANEWLGSDPNLRTEARGHWRWKTPECSCARCPQPLTSPFLLAAAFACPSCPRTVGYWGHMWEVHFGSCIVVVWRIYIFMFFSSDSDYTPRFRDRPVVSLGLDATGTCTYDNDGNYERFKNVRVRSFLHVVFIHLCMEILTGGQIIAHTFTWNYSLSDRKCSRTRVIEPRQPHIIVVQEHKTGKMKTRNADDVIRIGRGRAGPGNNKIEIQKCTNNGHTLSVTNMKHKCTAWHRLDFRNAVTCVQWQDHRC